MYSELRKVQLEEKSSNDLYPVDPDMYVRAYEYISQLKEALLKDWDVSKARELENITKLLKDIENRRVEKLLKLAYNEVYNGFDPPKSLTREEEKFYIDLKHVIHEFMVNLESYSKRKTEVKMNPETDNNLNNSPQNKDDLIKVKVLKELPPFKSVSGVTLGPFSEGEVVEFPKLEAQVLIKRGVVEPIEV